MRRGATYDLSWLKWDILHMANKPQSTFRLLLSLAILAAVGLFGMLVEPVLSRFANMGLKVIERYHAEHGSYPPTLEAVHIHGPKTRWGYWAYDVDANGSMQLSVGNMDSYFFGIPRRVLGIAILDPRP